MTEALLAPRARAAECATLAFPIAETTRCTNCACAGSGIALRARWASTTRGGVGSCIGARATDVACTGTHCAAISACCAPPTLTGFDATIFANLTRLASHGAWWTKGAGLACFA